MNSTCGNNLTKDDGDIPINHLRQDDIGIQNYVYTYLVKGDLPLDHTPDTNRRYEQVNTSDVKLTRPVRPVSSSPSSGLISSLSLFSFLSLKMDQQGGEKDS